MKKGISKYQTSLTTREQTKKRREVLQRLAIGRFNTAYSYENGFGEIEIHRILFGGHATDYDALKKNRREVKVIMKQLSVSLKLPFVWLRSRGNSGELRLCVPYHDWEWDQWEDHQLRISSGLQKYIKEMKALRVNVPNLGLVDTASTPLVDDKSKKPEKEMGKK